jgi:uncharacterized membrane protein YfcA
MNTEIAIATIGIFVGELYGNIVGGGSLVTQAVLQNILNLDIKTAMALDNVAIIGSNIGMLTVLIRKYTIKWWFFIFIIFQSIGVVIGSWILIKIDPNILKIIFIIAIVLLVIKNLFIKEKKYQGKGFEENYKNIALLSLTAAFIGLYNAAFVIGDWIIALLILTNVFSLKYHNAIFLLVFSMIFSQPIAAYQYYTNGLIDLNFLIPMISTTFVAGIISAVILNKIHSKKLEIFLKYLSVGLVVYLIAGLFT